MVKLMNLNPTENCFETRYHPSFLVLTGYVREREEKKKAAMEFTSSSLERQFVADAQSVVRFINISRDSFFCFFTSTSVCVSGVRVIFLKI
jgi:hypothetical protein